MFQERIEKLYVKKGGPQGKAWDLAEKIGFPDRKKEAYRKVPLQNLAKIKLLSKGKVQFNKSSIPAPILALTMVEAKKNFALFLENRAKERLNKETDFFAALTEALYEEGLFIYVPPGTVIEEPIVLDVSYEGEKAHIATHIQIFVGRKAEVSFYKKDPASDGCVKDLVDIYVDKGASCRIVNSHEGGEARMNFIRGSVKERGRLHFWSMGKKEAFFRQDFRIELTEEESEVVLKGASELREKERSHTYVLIEHKAPNARSNQHFKAVMHDASASTFEGKIFVEAIAQKTESYQLNNNLLLGEESQAFSKPNLEIFADDVKASHGATIGRLSEEELFYFRTRGISKEEAAAKLSAGFLDEIIKDAPYGI